MHAPQLLASTALLSSLAVAESVDYIVVGGGTSGLLVANRLSRDAGTTVAVVDPGSDQRENAIVKSPNDWLQILGTYVAEPHVSVEQTHAGNRKLTFLSGRGIGGTSLINGAWTAVGNGQC